MTTTGQNLGTTSATAAPSTVRRPKGSIVVSWITSTDHKTIGYMYLISSFVFFCLAGVMALLIRAELFEPGMQILQTKEQYNQLFTMHGTMMLLMFATPLFAGFANVIMPLQIGSPDVAFPRLNMFSFWLFMFGGMIAAFGFLTPEG
ncbi:MAG: cbb3-type cytochrome c oxidase subunit I, partial [Actinomycetes bacterium]